MCDWNDLRTKLPAVGQDVLLCAVCTRPAYVSQPPLLIVGRYNGADDEIAAGFEDADGISFRPNDTNGAVTYEGCGWKLVGWLPIPQVPERLLRGLHKKTA